MSAPIASKNIAPITDANKGVDHQPIFSPSIVRFVPSYYTPVPIISSLSGVVGTAYSDTITTNGGTAPYSYAKRSGTLPTGLSLSGATISGTPTTAGTYTFTIQVTDVNGQVGSQSFTMTISTPSSGGSSAASNYGWSY